jgi:hypothetical protein
VMWWPVLVRAARRAAGPGDRAAAAVALRRVSAERNALAAALCAAQVAGWANSYRLGVNTAIPSLVNIMSTPWGRANNAIACALMHQVGTPIAFIGLAHSQYTSIAVFMLITPTACGSGGACCPQRSSWLALCKRAIFFHLTCSFLFCSL